MKPIKNPINLKAVASLAGVSIATVSRVLNGDSVVKEETRWAVQKAIKATGYRPNRVAQRLRSSSRSKKMIGLLIPDVQNPFYVDVIKGVEEYAYNHGSLVVIGNFSQDGKKEKLYLDILRSESVDGFIVAPFQLSDPFVEELIQDGYPVVCIDRGLKNVAVDVVKSDNQQGAFRAVEHLIRLGHTRIAHIRGDITIPTTHERIAGYREALESHGITFDEKWMIGKASDFQSGLELTQELLDWPERPTAIFTANNLITLGALETLHSRGIRIPEEMAIVGFDDMYWASSLNPPLTAVRQYGSEIGKRAIELLFQRILDPDRPPANMIVQTELMIRRSCGSR